MFKTSLDWLVFCLVAVHAYTPIPVSPVGPFDEAEDSYFSPVPKPDPDPQEGDFFEGDVRIAGKKVGNAGTTRVPWPKAIIPYRFDCSVENMPSAIKATRDAMKEWEQRTCIRFVEKRPQDKAFLELFRAAGCWATYVGYRKDTKTQISIGSGCDYKHVMEHELGHVIGFWHEQSRSDRDNYIRIVYSNVVKALQYNFDKVREETFHFGQPYDYGSIMHYPLNAFAINRAQDTIVPTRSLGGKTPYIILSDSDVIQTKKMYKCDQITAGRSTDGTDMRRPDIGKLIGNLVSTECIDMHEKCGEWSTNGHCDFHPDPMLALCRKSCGNCGPCEDAYGICRFWSHYGYCVKYPYHMYRYCKESCQICRKAPIRPLPTTKRPTKVTPGPPTKPPNKNTIRIPGGKFTGIRCVDRSNNCEDWAKTGRCDTDRWVMVNCLLSCKKLAFCDPEPIKPIGPSCVSPLGVGWDNRLPNGNFYGTSTFSPGGGWYARAFSGRLYLEDDHSKKYIGAWCAQPRSKDQYLQIDLSALKTITAVATQGRDRYFEHVKSYYLSFSEDRRTWSEYEENGERKIFEGNCDHFTPVMNILQNRQIAQYIRFYPVNFIGAMCLRVEVYGCSYN